MFLVQYFLAIVSVSLFLYGFFPVSEISLSLENEPPTYINNISLNKDEMFSPTYSRTVMIVIDALRLDFVNKNDMPFTSRLVEQNGCFSEVKVEVPTVTLPRIKALTVGNVPQFIDLVLNLGSTEIVKDSLIHSALRSGKKVVFYGDNTWLKLFPDKFYRHEGTTSFFVRDFIEVDDNVTRNVHLELENDDWDIMILHYLGLDHIGHVYGPFSSLVPSKLHEMDMIVHKIHGTMVTKHENTLLIVTGDHGMRDSGGHGGSTYAETNVPFIIIGHECESSTFPQSDIPVNLAVLLGLRIPSTTIGRLQKKLLQFVTEKYLYMLHYNSLLLLQKSSLGQDHFQIASSYHELYLKNSDEMSAQMATELYENCSEIMSQSLITTSTEQNLTCMICALMIMFIMLLKMILKITELRFSSSFLRLFGPDAFITGHLWQDFHITTMFLIFVSFIQPLTLISSSFIEEEHQFWYFFHNLIILFCMFNILKKKSRQDIFFLLCLLSAFRFLRKMNSTGDMWANEPDISDWLLKDENHYFYQLFFILGLSLVFFAQCILIREASMHIHVANFIILALIFIYKSDDDNVVLGRIIWFSIMCHFAFLNTWKVSTWILMSCLMLKPYNIILVPYCIFSSLFLSKQFEDIENIFVHSLLGNVLFFAQGHSNSLASVDISVGYVGLEEYHAVIVIPQVLSHTYVFPVLCHILILHKTELDKRKVWNTLFSYRLYTYFVVCIVTLIFRHHLFVWSVFAPKLFIESVHMGFLFIEICFSNVFDLFRLQILHYSNKNK